jgi:hypothetical protein
MKIYFTAAISLSHLYGKYYQSIVEELESLGHTVIHEHITQTTLEDIGRQKGDFLIAFYKKVNRWISSSDLVIAELSFPSTLNVGHEVSLALQKNKPVIGLFLDSKDSLFFQGIKSDKFLYQNYNPKNLASVVRAAVDYCQDKSDVRFNFFISPSIGDYLDWIAKIKMIPRSVYLRMLIEQDMEHNKEYHASL